MTANATQAAEEFQAVFNELEENLKKYMEDLMEVQNQREYAAMLKEIDAVKSRISEHEEAILKDMEEIETVKGDLASHESHIQEERKHVKKEHAEIEATADAARESIAHLGEERTQIESELPKSLLAAVRRLEIGRQGIFLSKAEDGICQSCFVRVRPQGFQEVKLAIKIHYCSNCKRLLYHQPSLERMAAAGMRACLEDGAHLGFGGSGGRLHQSGVVVHPVEGRFLQPQKVRIPGDFKPVLLGPGNRFF